MIPVSSKESLDLYTLVQRLRENMPQILRAYPAVQLAYLYGSAATDSATRWSDVDIALVAARSLSIGEALNAELEVYSELMHRANIRNADVRLITNYPLTFQGQVVSRGILVYAQDEAFRVAYETQTRDAYLDFKPTEDKLLESLLITLRPGGDMFDREKVLKLLRVQRDYLKHLRTLSQIAVEQFVADPNATGAARYYFLIAVETCLDIGNHLIAAKQFRAPTDYADVFTILGENKIILPEFAQTMRKMAGFRNLLVHVYAEVDDRRVHEYLETRLGDFAQFQQYILQFIEKQ
ncbi:MAG: DUF86 domain-containing protein [Chloroflexi bacterium]|nr:DUF86 domain-containing protein [Chloroflexota bacterium]